MKVLGLVVTFIGFLIAFASLPLTQSVGARMVIVLIGIIVSVFGIIGLLNQAYLKEAIWRK